MEMVFQSEAIVNWQPSERVELEKYESILSPLNPASGSIPNTLFRSRRRDQPIGGEPLQGLLLPSFPHLTLVSIQAMASAWEF